MSDSIIPCETCGTLIEGVHTHRFMGMEVSCHQTHCKECEYQEDFRKSRLCERPYRNLFPRPGKDGKMPERVREQIAKQHEQRKTEKDSWRYER